MLRIDFEEKNPIADESIEKLISYVQIMLDVGVNAIILSDYGKGACTERLCQFCIKGAHRNNVPVFIDPKGNNWMKYKEADYITPNVKELGEALGKQLPNEESVLENAVKMIREKYKIDNIICTRSEKGMVLFLRDGKYTIPTVAQDVFDVSGAGDTVISAMSAGISGGLSVYEAAMMASFGASIGISKVGTYAVSRDEIIQRIDGKC